MNRRHICRILEEKHMDFVDSIKDATVKALINKNSIITGGAIVSLLLNQKVKDFDYYFTDLETTKAVANYFVRTFNEMHPDNKYLTTTTLSRPVVQVEYNRVRIMVPSAGIVGEGDTNGYQYFESLPDEQAEQFVDQVTKAVTEADAIDSAPMEKIVEEKYRPVFMTSNAITLSDRIQLVIRFFGNPEEIHKNYDFIHCTNYWLSSDKKLYLNSAALESILCKHLSYQGSLYPVSSVIRTRKFLRQGWYINAGQYLKMCFQISELDLTNISVLEDQLTGVDAAYFYQIIDYCKKKQAENKEFKVSAPYLVSIIDRIFG